MELINSYSVKTTNKIISGYNVRIETYISRGWEILRKRMDYFILFTLIFFLANSVPFAAVFLLQPLAAGFILVAFALANDKEVIFESFFEGFRHFAALLLFSLFSILLIFFGFLALILPGIYLSVGYIFAPFYIVFGKMDFWDAMESSRKLVHREWFSIFAFLIVLALINIAGLLAFGVGLLVTVPLSYCAIYAAFDDIIEI